MRVTQIGLLLIAASGLAISPAWPAPPTTPESAAPASPAKLGEAHFSSDLMFPYLSYYWSLPAEKRSMFVPTYTIVTQGQPLAGLTFFLKVGNTLKPIEIGPGGQIETLPSAEDIKGHPDVVVRTFAARSETFQLTTNIGTHPLIEPALEIDAAKCAIAIDQVNGAIPKAARMMGFAPSIKAVGFKDAVSGVAVLSDGRTVQLPLSQFGAPMYDPKKIPAARLIRLERVPSMIVMIQD